jgi:hypothetical protein
MLDGLGIDAFGVAEKGPDEVDIVYAVIEDLDPGQ